MPKTREQKRTMLHGLSEKVGRSKAVVFAAYNALGVKQTEELRKLLRAEDSELLVTKKTLLNIALKDNNIEANIKPIDGQVATILSYSDEVAAAKILGNFRKASKENKEKIDFAGGILEGKYIDKASVTALAEMPSKQELYARLVGTINAPVSGFVNVLAGNLRGLVNVLNAVKDSK
jgi:large subunit ribosomal protein L10